MWKKIPEDVYDLDKYYKKLIGPYIRTFFSDKKSSTESLYEEQEMLRDIFLWSIYMSYDDIAFVLLLRLKSRTGAALLAAGIAKRLSLLTTSLELSRKFRDQACQYEIYATECIEACHRHNEERAYKLLLLSRSLYGQATYMQVS